MRPLSRARCGALLLVAVLGLVALAGCWASEIRRVTIDVDGLAAWAGQSGSGSPDSLIGGLVPVTSRVPELLAGDVEGVEEIGLYVQLQNASFQPVEVLVVAHRSVVDRATLLAEGVRLTSPIVVQPQSALQIDARNYLRYARGFEEMVQLVLGGDFFLYVVSEASTFAVNGNVPTISLLFSIAS